MTNLSGCVAMSADMDPTSTMLMVKQQIHAKTGIRPFQQELVLGRGSVDDDEALSMAPNPCELMLLVLPADASWSPRLISAASDGNLDEVKRSLRSGADLDFRDEETGLTALMVASCRGHASVVRCLYDARGDLEAFGPDGSAPLLFASYGGQLEAVQLLCELQADLETRNSNGATPVMHAAQEGHIDVLRQLCSHKASVNSQRQGRSKHCLGLNI